MSNRTIEFPIIVEGINETNKIQEFLRGILKESVGSITLDSYYDEFKNFKIFYALAPMKDGPECNIDLEETQVLLREKGWKPEGERYAYPQISFDSLSYFNETNDYSFIASLISSFPGFFDNCDSNHEATDKLIKAGVVSKNKCDPESSCSYFYFKTKKSAQVFVKRFNEYIKNKYEAMETAKNM